MNEVKNYSGDNFLTLETIILVGGVEAERPVSGIRQVHNWLRDSMSTDFLGVLAIIAMVCHTILTENGYIQGLNEHPPLWDDRFSILYQRLIYWIFLYFVGYLGYVDDT